MILISLNIMVKTMQNSKSKNKNIIHKNMYGIENLNRELNRELNPHSNAEELELSHFSILFIW